MSKILGVDTSTIDNISGIGSSSGGIAAVPATTDTGIVVCPKNSSPYGPFSTAELAEYSNLAHMFQLSDMTGVAKLVNNNYQWGALKTNGEFYIGGYTQNYQMGLSSTAASAVANNGGLALSLSGVSKIVPHQFGWFAIKTNGEMWYTGYPTPYFTAAQAAYVWRKMSVGTDDWYDITAYPGNPYQVIAIKGAAGSRYLYASGRGTSYGTGQGSTSTLSAFTRVKSSSGTDLAESMSMVKTSYASCIAISDSGKLYTWGDNPSRQLGTGNTTDKQYATQIPNDPEDWSDCWINRYGGWAKNTSGEMFLSTSTTQWKVQSSTGGTFSQVGSDTDFEDLAIQSQTTSSLGYISFAKKGGVWHVCHASTIPAGEWAGEAASSAITSYVTVNSILQANDITGTVDYLLPYVSSSANNNTGLMLALS